VTEYVPARIFKIARAAKNISGLINTIASIWRENMLSENCSLFGRDNIRRRADEYPCIFPLQMEGIVCIDLLHSFQIAFL